MAFTPFQPSLIKRSTLAISWRFSSEVRVTPATESAAYFPTLFRLIVLDLGWAEQTTRFSSTGSLQHYQPL